MESSQGLHNSLGSSLPVFDIGEFLSSGGVTTDACYGIANSIRSAGAVIIRDPRCAATDNARFTEMMQSYFSQPHDVKLLDARPDLHYQVGATPAGTEVPRILFDNELIATAAALPDGHRAHVPTGADPKWRFFWRVGPRPDTTDYPELNAGPVVPAGFPHWAEVMDTWGNKMLAALEVVAQMLAVGLGLPKTAFTDLMHNGPHLLAPTGINLSPDTGGALGTVYAGYHYDLNFLTIHGKSSFPGLYIWLRSGLRMPVSIPEGCLLVQAGKQLEWLTGGDILAGMHEVVHSAAVQEAVDRAAAEGRSLCRVSSTVFGAIASDQTLAPMSQYAQGANASKYAPIQAGKYVEEELAVLKLKKSAATPGIADSKAPAAVPQQAIHLVA
eukprot:jgi/Mesvir1/25196/Mv12892-RA.1